MGDNGLEQIQNLDDLKASGFDDQQARAILRAMSHNVATKFDVEIAKLQITKDLTIKIEESKNELTYRIFYFFLATIATLGGLMAWMKFFVPVA